MSPSRRDCVLALDGSRHELSEAAVPAEEVDQNLPFAKSTSHQSTPLSVCLSAGCFRLADVSLNPTQIPRILLQPGIMLYGC